MAGDHKCSVCQATFTRPQHVARHMRSHTGDRPYKCLHCGDQFARSDLLSRHVNKCHASEKPLPSSGSRRKGSASASRATTSKQACDQCVQSSLPCDGCNPCAKCVQRKCRCTFVKFHRQTAPSGPGHNPQPTIPSVSSIISTSSNRFPSSYPSTHRSSFSTTDDFLLGPPPPHSASAALAGGGIPSSSFPDSIYSDSATFSFGNIYPPSSAQTTSSSASQMGNPALMGDLSDYRYRVQADMLRRSVGGGPGPGDSSMYADPRASPVSVSTSWPTSAAAAAAWDQARYDSDGNIIDKDLQHFMNSNQHLHNDSTTGTGATMYPAPPTGPFLLDHHAPQQHQLHHQLHQHPHDQQQQSQQQQQEQQHRRRRTSLDFSSSDGSNSIPSSAASSSVHLPVEVPLPVATTMSMHPRGRNPNQQQQEMYPHHHPAANSGSSSIPPHQQELSASPDPQQQQQQQQRKRDSRSQPGAAEEEDRLGGQRNEGGFHSAFGLMSLDDPAVIAGLEVDGVPFFSASSSAVEEGGAGAGGAGAGGLDLDATPMGPPPTKDVTSSAGGGVNGGGGGGVGDSRELREFWKQYMRTPLSGPGGGSSIAGGYLPPLSPTGTGTGAGYYRRPRVASLPSVKTPMEGSEEGGYTGFQQQQRGRYQQQQQPAPGGQGGQRQAPSFHQQQQQQHGNNPEDLRSYEAAVLARRAVPVNLNMRLNPMVSRRGTTAAAATATAAGRSGSGSGDSSRPGSAESLSELAYAFGRPGSTGGGGGGGGGGMRVTFAPTPTAAAGGGGGEAAGTLGPLHHQQHHRGYYYQQHAQSGSNSPDTSRSRESSVAFSDGSAGSAGGGEYGGGGGDSMGAGRPSFKRLPSQTLGPATAKRALVVRGGAGDEEGGSEGHAGEGEAGEVVPPNSSLSSSSAIPATAASAVRRGDNRHVVPLAERRRRMSVPTATTTSASTAAAGQTGSPSVPSFSLGLGALGS